MALPTTPPRKPPGDGRRGGKLVRHSAGRHGGATEERNGYMAPKIASPGAKGRIGRVGHRTGAHGAGVPPHSRARPLVCGSPGADCSGALVAAIVHGFSLRLFTSPRLVALVAGCLSMGGAFRRTRPDCVPRPSPQRESAPRAWREPQHIGREHNLGVGVRGDGTRPRNVGSPRMGWKGMANVGQVGPNCPSSAGVSPDATNSAKFGGPACEDC